MTTKVNNPSQKTNLQRFYQGWHHFQSMSVGENFIVFKVAVLKQVPDCIKQAEERIAKLSLPLVVLNTGASSNTYIVREIAA